jgi:hypothetical protein
LETLREKQKVQLWKLKIRQSAQTTLRENFEIRNWEEMQTMKKFEETIDHLTSECPILAKNEYVT